MTVLSDSVLAHLLTTSHLIIMLSQSFYLLGEAPASARAIEADENAALEDLKDLIASHFAIVVADGKNLSNRPLSIANFQRHWI